MILGNHTSYTSSLPHSPLQRRMLIGCVAVAPPLNCRAVGRSAPLLLSFCPCITQLPLSPFSHGNCRSVHTSSAPSKASLFPLQAVQHVFDAGQHLSLAVDVPLCCCSCCVCYLCLSVGLCISIKSWNHVVGSWPVTVPVASVGSCKCTAVKILCTLFMNECCLWFDSGSW